MINPEKTNFLKRPNRTSIMGLSLDGNRLEGVVLRRVADSIQLQQSFSVALSLDPLTADPVLVGTEIRNHLDAAGVRERTCVVCLPSRWALTLCMEVPELPESDVASFLQIEAEREFPCDAATLRICSSRCQLSGGKRFATQIGIPANHLALLDRALATAKLNPVSFSLGVTMLHPPSDDALMLAIGNGQVDLQVTCGGGVATLRTLEGALEDEGGRREIHDDVVAREVRITLGQLPAEFRELVSRVRVFGPDDLARQLSDKLNARLASMGMGVDPVTTYGADDFGATLPADVPVSCAFSFAARWLDGNAIPCEFLPERIVPWRQFARRYTSGPYRMAGAIAGAVAILVGGAFLVQQWQLTRLRSQWLNISAKATELSGIQRQIQQYQPWFDDSFRCLSILRRLTEAFPDDGGVSAKAVEIREMNMVTCTGVARDNRALLKALSQLRAASGVSDLKIEQIRGTSPMQFTFNFRWTGGGPHEN